jgi:hypothetical protein
MFRAAIDMCCHWPEEQHVPGDLQNPGHLTIERMRFLCHPRCDEVESNIQLLGPGSGTGGPMYAVAVKRRVEFRAFGVSPFCFSSGQDELPQSWT